MILTKLDRYIIRKFIGTFIFMLILLMSISIVFDLSEKLNELIANGAPWDEIIFIYYSNFFIHYGVQFSYLLNFIAVIWFTSKMANNTEIVPILSAGVSFNRFLRPYFISSAIIVLWAILMYNFVLPGSNRSRIEFEEVYYRAKTSRQNVVMQLSDSEVLRIYTFHGETHEITNMAYQKWKGDSIEYILSARKAKGDSLNNNWTLRNYSIRRVGEFHDDFYYGASVDTTLSFGVTDIIFRPNVIEAMDNSELNAFIEEQERKGSDQLPIYLIEKHKRWASPFAIIVLTVIGASLASKRARGGLGINIALGLSICVLYIFAMQMTTVAAINVGFTPVLAVWLPNIIFSVIAFVLYRQAQK